MEYPDMDAESVLLMAAVFLVTLLVAIGILFRRERINREALEKSENRFRMAMKHSAIGMALMRSDGQWLAVNNAFCHLTGYSEPELLQRNFRDIAHPDDLDDDLAQFESLLHGGVLSYQKERRYLTREGKSVWVRLSVSVAYNRDNHRYFITQIEDIHAAKLAEKQLEESRRRLELAVTAGQVGIWQYNLKTETLVWDARMYALYDVEQNGPHEGSLDMWRQAVHADDVGVAEAAMLAAVEAQSLLDIEFRIIRQDGQVRYIRARAEVLLDDEGEPLGVLGTNWDVSDAKQLQASLAEEKARLRVTLNSIADGVIATDQQGAVSFMNPVAESLTGWREHEAYGVAVDNIFTVVMDDGQTSMCPISIALRGGDASVLREGTTLVSRDGSRYDIQDSAAPLKNESGDVIGAVMVFRDVSARRAMQKKLHYHATHDSLTGLTNRREFEHALQTTLEQADGEWNMLCFIDLDRFKVVNDTAGHVAGDALLRECARVIAKQTREGDVLARLGGDEFGLILRRCPPQRAVQIAERLIATLDDLRFTWNESLYDIGASVGLVQLDDNILTVEAAMSRADVACYAAKYRGRSQVSVYTPDDSEASRRHHELQMAAGLNDSLAENRFLLYGQEIRPIQGCAEEEIHYEVLLRLRDQDGAVLSPGAFIPAAERYQVMPKIDRWVLKEVFVNLKAQLAQLPHMQLSINLSATSLDDSEFIAYLEQLLRDSQLEPSRFTFEITETTVVNQMSSAISVLETIRSWGCKVALDDFGSGFSSFSYLKQFAVDSVKIDGSFVRNMLNNQVDGTIVESINEVAHRLGVKTVAEYVEDLAMLPALEKAGVDYAQGYAIGKPVSLIELFDKAKEAAGFRDNGRAVAEKRPPLH